MKRFLVLALACILAVSVWVAHGMVFENAAASSLSYASEEVDWDETLQRMDHLVDSVSAAATPKPVSGTNEPSVTPGPLQINPDAKMTLMIYMCGSNLERCYGAATRDLMEIASSGVDPDQVNVVVLAGGAKKWKNDVMQGGKAGIYLFRGESVFPLGETSADLNMGDPSTLYAFLKLAYQYFPAQRSALILWDHGGGSINGICSDEVHDGDLLSMPELTAALEKGLEGQDKLEWIGFDACLMASAEVANMMQPYARYMIASEESEPGRGWNYQFLKDIEKDPTGGDTGMRAIDSFFDAYGDDWQSVLTLSCIDLSQMDGVIRSTSGIFQNINLNEETFLLASDARREAIGFGHDETSGSNDFDLVDIGNLADEYSKRFPELASYNSVLKESMSKAVVSKRSNADDCTGLSFYHPFYNKTHYPTWKQFYDGLAVSQEYVDYLSDFSSYWLNASDTSWDQLTPHFGGADKDVRTILAMTLTEDQLREARKASLLAMLRGKGQDGYCLVARQDAFINEDRTVTGEYVHTNLFVTDEQGKPIWDMPLCYTVTNDGAYEILAALQTADDAPEKAKLICSRDEKTQAVSIDMVWLYDEMTGVYSQRTMVDLADYDAVIFSQEERTVTTDANGAVCAIENWNIAERHEYACPVASGVHLAFVRDYLDTAAISIAFELTDVFNNRYASSLLSLDTAASDKNMSMVVTYDDLNAAMIQADDISLAVSSNGKNLRLSMQLTNILKEEALVEVNGVLVNGQSIDAGTAVYGMGSFDGLMPNETQMMTLPMKMEALSGIEVVESIEFTLSMINEAGEKLASVPIRIDTDFSLQP